MSSVVISGDTSGSISLTAPAVAGSNTITLPASTGTALTDASTGVCRAWVNFNGVPTVTVRGSYNVSSVTRAAAGDYTVNFTTAMADANYAVVTGLNKDTATGGNTPIYAATYSFGTAPTASSCRIVTGQASTSSFADSAYVYVSFFR